MVLDVLKNASSYFCMNERLAEAFKFLQEKDFSKIEPGRYEIDGTAIYALVQQYVGIQKDEGMWEAHKRYIDIQYIVEGDEMIGYANVGKLNIRQEYDAVKDCLLLDGSGNFFEIHKGEFVIFTPEDAHMPGLAVKNPKPVKKVVIKVAVGTSA
jgi:uncharacterized protein, YhcH/YjgK/YiaL family